MSPVLPNGRGGERFGAENNDYYAELRGQVNGAASRRRGRRCGSPASSLVPGPVEQRFLHLHGAVRHRCTTCSCSPTRTTRASTRPTQLDLRRRSTPAPTSRRSTLPATAPRCGTSTPRECHTTWVYSATTTRSSGTSATTASPKTRRTSSSPTPFGQLPDIGVAERQQFLTMAVRDYLNEGGKLVHAGETSQHSGLAGIGDVVGGLFYGLNGDPTAECVVADVPRLSSRTACSWPMTSGSTTSVRSPAPTPRIRSV